MRRTPLRAGRTRSRGSSLAPRSAKRQAGAADRQDVWAEILVRDRSCRMAGLPGVGPCMGRLTPHHLLKGSAGGAFTPANLLVVCAHHNDWVEDHPDQAHALKLVVRRADALAAETPPSP